MVVVGGGGRRGRGGRRRVGRDGRRTVVDGGTADDERRAAEQVGPEDVALGREVEAAGVVDEGRARPAGVHDERRQPVRDGRVDREADDPVGIGTVERRSAAGRAVGAQRAHEQAGRRQRRALVVGHGDGDAVEGRWPFDDQRLASRDVGGTGAERRREVEVDAADLEAGTGPRRAGVADERRELVAHTPVERQAGDATHGRPPR